jgi:hypothetical protein
MSRSQTPKLPENYKTRDNKTDARGDRPRFDANPIVANLPSVEILGTTMIAIRFAMAVHAQS